MKIALNPEFIPSILPPELEAKIKKAIPTIDGWCTGKKALHLAELIVENNPLRVVEIGVFAGRSLIPMALAVKSLGKGEVIGIDPWTLEAASEGNAGGSAHEQWWSVINYEKHYEDTQDLIDLHGLDKICKLWRKTSVDARKLVGDSEKDEWPIDLLHIDGNHSDPTSFQDVKLWLPLVREGGIIVFDDINWNSTSRAAELLKNKWCNGELQDFESYAVGIKKTK